ncbi:MAG: sigma 54-interacting transcriptional regulator [bacterium]
MAARIFAHALASREIRQTIQEQIRFEQLLSETSAKFVHVPASAVDNEIEQTLRTFVESLDVDRGTVYQMDPRKKEPYATHVWGRTGTLRRLPEGMRIEASQFPWFVRRLAGGEVVCNPSTRNLPEEASIDRQSLDFFEIKSNVAVPLTVGGRLVGALTFDDLQGERQWPEPFVKRVKVLGEIIANALERKVAEQKLRRSFAEIKRLKNQLQAENAYFREEIRLQGDFSEIIGKGRAIKYVLFKIEQIAPTDTTVLVLGETGTGKELVARAIHDKSCRKDRPLIKVNCAALPGTLMEGELFGHEKGAFTGAHQRQEGRFEIAHGSTLFLDEIGELPLELQAKLLRVLQSGEFERLGSPRTVKVDVRIIAASNRDLEKEVHAGRFRKDLWYRLNVFPITVPPLRDRKEDIPLLVNWFLARSCKKLGKEITRIPQQVLHELQAYPWPGNIRELENTIERAVINTPGHSLRLGEKLALPGQEESSPQSRRTLADVEREHLVHVLKQTQWRVSGPNGAALILGLKPSTLRFRIRKLGIRKPSLTR